MRFRRTLPAILLATSTASAAPTKEDVARADQLFREAQALSQKGQYAEACPKLAESQELDPAMGTALNLAICHENEGKTATAWRELTALVSQLTTSRDDRQRAKVANEHLRGLEKKLVRLTFDVHALPADATLTLDGARVDDPLAALPVDPGRHTLVASAPRKRSSSQTIDATEPGLTRSIKLDALEDETPAEPVVVTPPEPAAPPPKASSGRRTVGVVVASAGVVGLGIGVGFGLRTFSLKSQRDAHCTGTVCDAQGIALHDRARNAATVSTIAVAVGAAALVTGAVLFLTGAPKSDRAATARVRLTPDGLAF